MLTPTRKTANPITIPNSDPYLEGQRDLVSMYLLNNPHKLYLANDWRCRAEDTSGSASRCLIRQFRYLPRLQISTCNRRLDPNYPLLAKAQPLAAAKKKTTHTFKHEIPEHFPGITHTLQHLAPGIAVLHGILPLWECHSFSSMFLLSLCELRQVEFETSPRSIEVSENIVNMGFPKIIIRSPCNPFST